MAAYQVNQGSLFVFFEYIANVSVISVRRAQPHTVMISPCLA